MSIGVTVDVAGLPQKIRRARNRFDMNQLLASVGNAHLFEINKQFTSEGAHFGSPWKPLAPSTLARRRKKGRGAKILRDTRRLEQSFVRGKPDSAFRRNRTLATVTVGTQTEYAEQHEKGLARVPRRRILPTKAQARLTAKREVQAALRFAFRGANR